MDYFRCKAVSAVAAKCLTNTAKEVTCGHGVHHGLDPVAALKVAFGCLPVVIEALEGGVRALEAVSQALEYVTSAKAAIVATVVAVRALAGVIVTEQPAAALLSCAGA